MIGVVTLAFAILLLGVGSVFAGGNTCGALPTANANELMALPGADTFGWLPPSVSCTREGIDDKPHDCAQQTTITQDRMIGDYRLIVATSSRPDLSASLNPVDYVFVFTCVNGQIMAVTHAPFYLSQKQDYTKYASPGISRAYESGQPKEILPQHQVPNAPLMGAVGPEGTVVIPRQPIACGDLPNAGANQLLNVLMSAWHGPGCYPERGACDWYATLREDRMLTDTRRLIDVGATHRPLRLWCSDQVYVFGCVEGEARTVFEYRYPHLRKIAGGPDRLAIAYWSQNPQDSSWTQSLSWETRLTYSWSADLQSYVLKDMHIGPPAPGEGLPSSEPPCSGPPDEGIGTANPR